MDLGLFMDRKVIEESQLKDIQKISNDLRQVINDITHLTNTEVLSISARHVLKQATQKLEALQKHPEKLNSGIAKLSSVECFLAEKFNHFNSKDLIYFEDELRKYIIAYQPVFEHKKIAFEYSLGGNFILESDIEVIHKLIELMCLQTLHIPNVNKVNLATYIENDVLHFKADATLNISNSKYVIRVDNDSFMSSLAASVSCSFTHVIEDNFVSFNLTFQDANIIKTERESAASRQIKSNNLLNIVKLNKKFSSVKATLLIVEQNNELRQFLISLFEQEYGVLSARNAQEARILSIEEIPDLIISDILLPDHDGIWLQKELINSEKANHIPMLFLTAYKSKEIELKALKLGSIDLVSKPFDATQLILKIGNIIEKQLAVKSTIKQHDFLTTDLIDNTQKSFIKKLNNVLENHLADYGFSVTLLASEMAMSERQLQRKLKAISGCAPSEYISNYRLKIAEKMLTKGYSITQAAENCGFNTNSYFSKSFKAAYGESPSKYVKRL